MTAKLKANGELLGSCLVQTETEKLFTDLNKPTLHALSYALRHPETWPEKFVWNYGDCNQCAMGLAHLLWDSIPSTNRDNGASVMARKFAMPYTAANSIFLGQGGWAPRKRDTTGHLWWRETTTNLNMRAISPEMVADQIDKYLVTAE